MNTTFWLVEMQGPAYLSAHCLGKYEFYWTEDVCDAIRFFSRYQADIVMMTIRELQSNLFPSCLTRIARPVEHQFIDGVVTKV